MLTLGYNKGLNSLYKQNIDNVIWPFKGESVDLGVMQNHIDSPHTAHYTSFFIGQTILTKQISGGLNSDIISDGLFMGNFNPQPLTIDRLGFGCLEGAAHHYFTNDRVLFALMDSTVPYTTWAKGRKLWTSTGTTLGLSMGTVVGEVLPSDYVKIHSPGMINNDDDVIKPNTYDLENFEEIAPYVYQANPIYIDNYISFNWGFSGSSEKTGQYQLDPDILPPDGFVDITAIENNPAIVSMLDHINNESIHPGSWTTPVLSDNTTVGSRIINDLYDNYTLRYRPGTGDWYVTPDGGSMSYQEELTDPTGHWLAISKGDPDALVLDPDDPSIVLGECVNGTDEMRCYFTLADGKLPVATPTVILRRCNPVLGFTAKTLGDYAGP